MNTTIKLTGHNGNFNYGRYCVDDRSWLENNKGNKFTAERHNINYWRLTDNGMLVHLYEATEIKVSFNQAHSEKDSRKSC